MKKKQCFVLEIYRFLWNPHNSKSVTSSQELPHNGSCTRKVHIMEVAYFFWILSTTKIKFGQILQYCTVWQTFQTCFLLNAGDWKLIPGPFMILLKQQYSKTQPFFRGHIFNCPLFTFSRKWNTGILTLLVIE